MKTLIALFSAMCGIGVVSAQTPIVELDPVGPSKAALDAINTNTAGTKNALDELLKKADTQIGKLDDQLKRIGTYGPDGRPSLISAQGAMQTDPKNPINKTNAQLATERAAASGKDVFTSSADGTFTGIGAKYQGIVRDAKGKVVMEGGKMKTEARDRDETKYTEEGKQLNDINEFYRVRDQVNKRQTELEAARAQALADLLKTEDQAETQRLSTLIGSIDAELIAVRQDIANKTHELEVHEKEVALQKLVDSKAKSEEMSRTKAPTTVEGITKLIEDKKAEAEARAAAKKAAADAGKPFFERLRPKATSTTTTP